MQCRVRRNVTILASIFIVLGGVQVIAADGANEKTKQLLEKRLAIRDQILKLVTAGYQQGTNTFDQVSEAQSSLLRARLDLCETKEQRIHVYEEMARVAATALDLAKKHFQSGQASQVAVLKGEAHLLEVQIELENAKAAK